MGMVYGMPKPLIIMWVQPYINTHVFSPKKSHFGNGITYIHDYIIIACTFVITFIDFPQRKGLFFFVVLVV